MENYLYQQLNEMGNKHWWFVSKKRIVLGIIRKYLKQNKENKIVDVGCGSGLMLNALKEFGIVYGIDYSDEAIRFSKQVFDGEVSKGSLPDDIPYPGGFFNLVLALDVLEHIDDDSRALARIKDILTYNGICIITVPAHSFLWSGHDVVHGHKRRYTMKELKGKLRDENLKILKISYYNTFLFVPILIARLMNKIFRKKNESDAKIPGKYINRLLERIFSLELYILLQCNMKFGVSIMAVVTPI